MVNKTLKIMVNFLEKVGFGNLIPEEVILDELKLRKERSPEAAGLQDLMEFIILIENIKYIGFYDSPIVTDPQ